jgi:hypothetical protein
MIHYMARIVYIRVKKKHFGTVYSLVVFTRPLYLNNLAL